MVLFYTGAVQPNSQQNEASKSLGGYISNSIIPNGLLGNIFTDLSKTDIEIKKEQVRCIVLKNIFPTDQQNVKIWVETLNDKYEVQLGIVEELFLDETCNVQYLEQIQFSDQIPYYVDFINRTGEENAYIKSSLLKNGYIGIWLKRIPKDIVPIEIPNTGEILTDCDKEFYELSSDNIDVSETEVFNLIIDWGGEVLQSKVEWGYSEVDPLGNEISLEFQFNQFITTGQTSLSLDFTSEASDMFIYFKIPTGILPNMVTWDLDQFNSGIIPDQVFRQYVTIAGNDYCMSRVPVLMNSDTTVVFNI